jgi:uncharacterized protein (TIGR04255 family)
MADTRGVTVTSPFSLDLTQEAHLGASPLVSALLQVKFPAPLSKLNSLLTSSAMSDALADEYPYCQQISNVGMLFQPGQEPVQQPAMGTSWAYTDKTESWRAELSAESISLTTTAYTSRSEFCSRAEFLFSVVGRLANPPGISRVGVRYINRTQGDDLLDWIERLTPAARGIMHDLDREYASNVVHALSDVRYSWPNEDVYLQGRWGLAPPRSIIDMSMQPVNEPSWVLDIDIFSEAAGEFVVKDMTERVRNFSERAYNFFRWVIPSDALARFKPVGSDSK